jgi:hypothetical protein
LHLALAIHKEVQYTAKQLQLKDLDLQAVSN